MSQELDPPRYDFSYRNDFNNKYEADRDTDPEGEYVAYDDVKEAIEFWNRRATVPAAQPAGWVTLPWPMTDAMRDAANVLVLDRGLLVQIYKALIDAAPGAPITRESSSGQPAGASAITPESSAPAEAASVRDRVLAEAAEACKALYTGMGGPPDDPHPDAVLVNGAVHDCIAAIRALQGKPEAPRAGYCKEAEVCACGGDLPRVREGCVNWVMPEAAKCSYPKCNCPLDAPPGNEDWCVRGLKR